MPQPSTVAWLGAPPVSVRGFAFVNGEFFAEASGQQQHRRATPAELKAHFTSGSDKDHPAHWFEAQLVHYGLQPSKTKAVARMRLFDAVNAKKLTVPADIIKLEADLKKEWTKKDREAKKDRDAKKSNTGKIKAATTKTVTTNPVTTKTVAGVKRKAEDNVLGTNSKVPGSAGQRGTKIAKTALPKQRPSNQTFAKETVVREKAAPKAALVTGNAATTPTKKQTARRGGISKGTSRGRVMAAPSSPPPPIRTKQTARRSGAFVALGRIPAPSTQVAYFDEFNNEQPPPPYTEALEEDNGNCGGSLGPAPLGLLNGRYSIDCPEATSKWPIFGSDFGLILTLAGSTLWGSFDLGIVHGVLHFAERPWESSHTVMPFSWRGGEEGGRIFNGNGNEGWMRFLGDGRVEGGLDYQGFTFQGQRLSGQGTRSEIDAQSLQDQWDALLVKEYDDDDW